jgi:hypothetical protein
MISKRKGRRNGALPTVRRSIATAANFFFLYCYMYCCSSRAFYIYMYISIEIIYLAAPKDLVYNNNLGAQSLNSKRENSQREQQQIHDFPVSRKHYSSLYSI